MPNNTQQQIKMNVRLNNFETLTCPKCKNSVFTTHLSIFKKIPVIQSPTGKAQLVKLGLVSCPACNSMYSIKDGELSLVFTEELKAKV